MRFRDRQDAGEQVARGLGGQVAGPATVLGIPRGGVIVADAVRRVCGWPLDVVCPRKLRAPTNPELAFGAVTEDGTVYLDPRLTRMLHVDDAYLAAEIAAQLEEIERRRRAYRGARPDPALGGRTAVLVDDGMATGATVIAAARMVRHRLARQVVVAVPVGAAEALRRLEREVDRVVCVECPPAFTAVGEFYDDFAQVSDEEVVATLARAWSEMRVS